MQPHREESGPNAAALSVETRLDNSDLGPGIATGSTVDRTDISTASSAGLTAKKSFSKPPQPRKGDEEEIKRGGSGSGIKGSNGSGDGIVGLQREDSLDSALSKTSSSTTTTISPIVPVTREAYGGGIYGKDDGPKERRSNGGGGGGAAGGKKVYEDGSAIPYIQ